MNSFFAAGRRFLLHVLPSGFHRIRHYGLFDGAVRARNIERVRQWLAAPEASPAETDCDFEDRDKGPSPGRRCPRCVRPFLALRMRRRMSNPWFERLRQSDSPHLGDAADNQIAASVVGPRGERQIAAAL